VSTAPVRARLLWTLALACLSLAVLAGLDATGRHARRAFSPPPEFGRARWGRVSDAAEAVRVWMSADLNGQRLLLLTGRWAALQTDDARPPGAGAAADFVTPSNAVYATMRAGIARRMDIVLPEAVFRQRLASIRAARGKDVAEGPGWFQHSFHGYPRRFSSPAAVEPSEEPVLVLVEPSFFAADTPDRPDSWLHQLGFRVSLGLIAQEDPAAADPHRAAAEAFAQGVQAIRLEVGP
jgi:hypothetical protein